MGPLPLPYYGSSEADRVPLGRWLEVTSAGLVELHLMRREAEERVRGALRGGQEETPGTTIHRGPPQDMFGIRSKTSPLEDRMSHLGLKDLEWSGIDKAGRTEPGLNREELGPGMPAEAGPDLTEKSLTRIATLCWHQQFQIKLRPRWNWDFNLFNTGDVLMCPSLPRSGPGSLPPRFRLGSSGVTSDLLFTKRMTGSSLYAPSSGFFESSDLDSIASSSSSLSSETSTSTQMSMKSSCRVTAVRPWSTDFTSERRKELQSGRGGTRRPRSAGALDTFVPSIYPSRNNTPTYREEYRTLQDSHSSLPPLSVIQQRQRVERYICKLALKHRCKPGSSTLPTDHGPPIRRNPDTPLANLECSPRGPASPQYPTISTSVGDVRRTHKGSWGRFFSRVMLHKSSRTAASEMNLELCGRGNASLRGSSLEARQLPRTKSFRDLLSSNLFKKSERGPDNLW
uniref:Uncharacterized protein n=1 Tax=Leptobrachium leishanense TaxID=445787 RepID=A0A8C5WFK7_9ANUR